jgi:hypothetical protein
MRVALVTSSVVLALLTGCGNGMSTFGGSSGSVGVGGSVVTGGSGPIGPGGTFDEAVVVPASRPPAISGGTLLLIAQGRKAAVADPERDHVVIVDIDQLLVAATIPLQKGDEPGRLVEDGRGLLHVALRGSGAVATLDPVAGKEVGRVNVCAHPRGLAYDASADTVHVACAGGELVSLAATSGTAVRQLKLDRDLRDVVIDGDHLLVSRFRAAELLVVEADGHVSGRLSPESIAPTNAPPSAPPGAPGGAGSRPRSPGTIAAPGGGRSSSAGANDRVQINPATEVSAAASSKVS